MTLEMILEYLADTVAEKLAQRLPAQQQARLLNVRGAAKYLSLSQDAVRRMARAGKVPIVRDGRFILLDRRDLDEWIDKHKAMA